MKNQWMLLFGGIFTLIVAAFAVVNVDQVPVNYFFGTAQWPLILVILGSAILGVLLSISFAMYKMYQLRKEIKQLQNDAMQKNQQIGELQSQLATAKATSVEPFSAVDKEELYES